MKKRLTAILVALVVGTIVIYGGVQLFGMRNQLFRPDAGKAGGTEILVTLAEPATDEDLDRACEVLLRRFDDDGRAGVIVRRDGEKRLAIVVPNGRMHDDLVARVGRVACSRGRFEFRLLAHQDDDKEAVDTAGALFTAKKGPGDPADKDILTVGAKEKKTYRWLRASDGVARHWLRSMSVPAGGGRARRVVATDFGVTLHIQENAGSVDDYFVISLEPAEGERLVAGIQKARLVSRSPKQMSTIEFTFDEPTAERLRSQTAPLLASRHAAIRGVRILGGVLDGEVVLSHELYTPMRRKQTFNAWVLPSEAEDLTAVLRGGELPVKLDPKSLTENTVAPKR